MEINSVGIDIGTSTTQLVFSRLYAENTASYFSVPRVAITRKEVVYKSGIHTTPLLDSSRIDGEAIRLLVAEEYRKAGYTPADLQTGAVIITGESARKENAQLVLESLSGFAGEFVVATAGPDMEAIIAGQGSGAQQYSQDHGCTVVNLDIGGGTTNLAAFRDGQTIAKGCLDIGGRLVRLDEAGRVTSISPAAALAAGEAGVTLRPGESPAPGALAAVADVMVSVLAQQLGLIPKSHLLLRFQTPGSSCFPTDLAPRVLFFSGGVADCIHTPGLDELAYGDMGVILGRAIARSRLMTDFTVAPAEETIRATVVGAGSYTTTISGSTIYHTPGIFPQKNVPVLRLTPQEEALCYSESRTLEGKLRWFLEQCDTPLAALSLAGSPDPDYPQLVQLAGNLAAALEAAIPAGYPLLVVLDCDMAKALGQLMGRRLTPGRRLAVVDGVPLHPGEYIDFGVPILDGMAIPVVVKTLIFG